MKTVALRKPASNASIAMADGKFRCATDQANRKPDTIVALR